MKRLKIVEQIIIVLIIAVILPLFVSAWIIVNVNQHAVRKELNYAARNTANNVLHRLQKVIEEKRLNISNLSTAIIILNKEQTAKSFLSELTNSSSGKQNIKISSQKHEENAGVFYDAKNQELFVYEKIAKDLFIEEKIDIKKFEKNLQNIISDNKRQIYILDNNNHLLASINSDGDSLKEVLSSLPKDSGESPVFFGEHKNQPNIIINLKNPEWKIIVSTAKHATLYGIIKARYKIIIAIAIAAMSIILLVSFYTFSLYTNIRQLFKAITAIGKGNYSRRIRIIKNIFTPFEVVFLSNEFNKMAKKVDDAYNEIHKQNLKLAKMDEYKSNLIDTVSHEFRTPLTSIKGYTSRLLRNDVKVDEAMQIKSLKVIKQQTERLGRMVEDLLVIPDIESSLLRVFPSEINLKEIIETGILSVNQKKSRVFNFNYNSDTPNVWADSDRVEQVIINLLENAKKYSFEDSEINISVFSENNFAVVKVHNSCEKISEEQLSNLFKKFSRIDEKTTRTTRGTGLGLFIVKGLVEAMDGNISLSSQDGFEVTFKLPTIQE